MPQHVNKRTQDVFMVCPCIIALPQLLVQVRFLKGGFKMVIRTQDNVNCMERMALDVEPLWGHPLQ